MERIPVRLTVDRHRADAELLACANDAQRNLAAIRYQNFLEHDLPGMICVKRPALRRSALRRSALRVRALIELMSVGVTSIILPAGRRIAPGRTRWAGRWRRAS